MTRHADLSKSAVARELQRGSAPPPGKNMASSGANDDDFDNWLAKPTPGSAAAARAKGTPAAKPTESSSWFGGSLLESFNSTTASLASTLTSDPLLKSVGDQLSGVAGQLRRGRIMQAWTQTHRLTHE